MTFWSKQNYADNTKISDLQNIVCVCVWGEAGGRRLEQRGFLGQVSTLYDTKIMGKCHDTFFQTHQIYHTDSELYVN